MTRLAVRSCALAAALAAVVALTAPASAQAVRIADEETERIATPHPYPGGARPGEVVWRRVLHWPDASYIAVHFERFELAPGDVLVLRDPDGRYRHEYRLRGYRGRGGDFWGLSVLGDTMVLELVAEGGGDGAFGIEIDRWAHGYPLRDLPSQPEALCGTEDFKDVECYRDTYPTEYQKARAAVRLIKNGSAHCTGWLASCENHIITNEHCVGSQSELDQIEFQFDYKRPACGSGAPTVDLQLQGGTLLEVDAPLDYALIMPDLAGHDPQATYGFLQWDPRIPDIDELIYIPGHPSGDPKRLSLESTHPQDQSGRCEVYSTDQPACTGGPPDIGYYCDTEGGSSGSPVISAATHRVVALHHCANCPNRGVPIADVYDDIQNSQHPLPACATCEPTPAPLDLVTSTPADNQVRLDWQAAPGAVNYFVYRSQTSCDTGMVKIGETPELTYLDTDVSGGVTYYYRVTGIAECGAESPWSNCASAVPGGDCTSAPVFDGLLSAESARTSSCGVVLDWDPATALCGQVRYNVYRSVLPGFTPGPGNLIASCLTTTSYTDDAVLDGVTYHYIVRAEDDSGFGSGPCSGGNEDDNLVERSAAPTGPDDVFYVEDFESGGSGWILSGEWQIAVPQGKGGTDGGGLGGPDPSQAASGVMVLGHDISGSGTFPGNYEPGLSTSETAVSPAIDTRGRSVVRARFRRWLGTDRAPDDRATFEVFDGNSWSEAWSNPEFPLFDTSWVTMDLDVSRIAGVAAARLRFAQTSDPGATVAAGWNVDAIELYSPTSCQSGAVDVPPVPDGRFVPGTPMTASRVDATYVRVRWDVSSCPGPSYHLLSGDSDELPVYGYSGAACLLDPSGTAEVPVTTPAPGHFTWWVIVAADGPTEGIHGYDSSGATRPASAGGLCGLVEQSAAGTCR
ncbi:MAG: hypothetical protein D6718_04400 [Acidobacteria bacterium]|nr:MAG: hypothetical protein D6718_04400 [Acidobacteriota bacterium]